MMMVLFFLVLFLTLENLFTYSKSISFFSEGVMFLSLDQKCL